MRLFSCLLAGLIFATALSAAADPLATLHRDHPRLLFTAGTIEAALTAAETDPLRAKLHEQVVRAAERHLQAAPIRYVLVGPRMLDQSRKALAQVTTCAMAYRLTGDQRYADRARDVMLTAAAFPDWNPSHFLDVAEMATALGLGYDWLYDRLTPAERVTIKRALLDKALAYVRPAYARADPDRESFPFVKGNLTNNWNQVCNGGFLIAALAIAEDEPAIAREVLAGLRETLPVAMRAYEPDGAYPEGPVYWGYGTRYNVLVLAALESALGDDFGLGRLPGFDRTELFRLHVQSPTGLSFNFADGRAGLGADSGLTWLAQHHRQPVAEAHSRELLAAELEREPNLDDRFMATTVLWFPGRNTAGATLPLDANFDGPSKLAVFRSAWGDPGALWTGLKAGSNRVNHGHLDLGSFMLDADGVRWAVDLGPDNYDLPGYWDGARVDSPRWQYYRLNNRSHNTLTPGEVLQSPDADGRMLAFRSTPERAFAVADLTPAYPRQARSFHRGVAMLDRARVLVQDEVEELGSDVSLTWRMLTPAAVAFDGRQARLTLGGRALRVEILEPRDARFVSRPATPPTAVETQNTGVTELRVEVPPLHGAARTVRIAVLLSPEGDKWPSRPAPALVPLAAWD